MEYKSAGFVAFEDAELVLLQTALRSPALETSDNREIFAKERWLYGDLSKYIKTGWIFFDFPVSSDSPEIRGSAQVWTGYSKSCQYLSEMQKGESLMMSFTEGVISESKLCIKIKERQLYASKQDFSRKNHDESLPARQLLTDGLAWILEKTIEFENQKILSLISSESN